MPRPVSFEVRRILGIPGSVRLDMWDPLEITGPVSFDVRDRFKFGCVVRWGTPGPVN